jgi:hypothetical protein
LSILILDWYFARYYSLNVRNLLRAENYAASYVAYGTYRLGSFSHVLSTIGKLGYANIRGPIMVSVQDTYTIWNPNGFSLGTQHKSVIFNELIVEIIASKCPG